MVSKATRALSELGGTFHDDVRVSRVVHEGTTVLAVLDLVFAVVGRRVHSLYGVDCALCRFRQVSEVGVLVENQALHLFVWEVLSSLLIYYMYLLKMILDLQVLPRLNIQLRINIIKKVDLSGALDHSIDPLLIRLEVVL